MAISDIFIPVLPIDLAGDYDSASGSAGAALISARWAATAAILRNALAKSAAGSERQPATQDIEGCGPKNLAPQGSEANQDFSKDVRRTK